MINLIHGDFFTKSHQIDDGIVDLICTDLPYGKTKCSWDQKIDLEKFWNVCKRILKKNGCVVLNSDMDLAVSLINSSPKKWFRYDIVWDKIAISGFLDANRRPLRQHEFLLVFSPVGYPTYNPQKTRGVPYSTTKKK